MLFVASADQFYDEDPLFYGLSLVLQSFSRKILISCIQQYDSSALSVLLHGYPSSPLLFL